MDKNIRKPRNIENPNDRAERIENVEQQRRDDDAAEDERIDEMVRQNVKQRGA